MFPGSYGVYRGLPSRNEASVLLADGRQIVFCRGELVWKSFKDGTYVPDKFVKGKANLFFIDGFFGNCGIDNIRKIEPVGDTN